MNIDELKSAIERRGYRVAIRSDIAGIYTLGIVRGQNFMSRQISAQELDYWKIEVGQLAEMLLRHLSKDQHHVMCANCKLPLLYEEVYVPGVRLAYGVPLEVVNNDHMEKRYRLVVSGPEAKYHTHCPGCGVLLDGNTDEPEIAPLLPLNYQDTRTELSQNAKGITSNDNRPVPTT